MTLTIGLMIALIVPVVFATLSVVTGKFVFNLGVTGTCIVLLAVSPQPLVVLPLIVCFAISMLGDFFMGHQHISKNFYLFGIMSFLCAHVCLMWYSYPKVDFSNMWVLIATGVLAVGYGLYLAMRILHHVEGNVMRAAVCTYASVSVLALMMAGGMVVPLLQRVLYALGVLSIVVSDTIICECDFGGNEKLSKLIMPTYFACHVLITASALVATL